MDAQPGTSKRKLVENDDIDVEVQETKKQRVKLDENQKKTCIKALAAIYVFVCSKNKLSFTNLHVSAQIANAIKTCFNTKRQEVNGTGTLKNHAEKILTITNLGKKVEITRQALTEDIITVLGWFGLKMEKPKANDKNHWWGTFMPYLTYTCCWQLRMKELRLGHGSMILKKEADGTEVVAKVKDYGLKSRHHILLEGITFPPEVRATIAQSVGPLTTLISVSKETKDSRYGKKHRDAAARAYAHIPGVETIIKTLEGTKAKEAAPLIGALADLTLLIPARNQRRAYFPIAWIANAALSQEEWKHYQVTFSEKKGEITYQPSKKFESKKGAMETEADPILSDLTCWDMSGKGAALIYNAAANHSIGWSMPKTKEFDAEMMGQACFHAAWGSYCEDLSLIEWMTGTRNWRKRREMGGMFLAMGEATSVEKIILHPLIYYSKLVSANITNMMTETNDQVSSNPVWSGKRQQKFSQELFDALESCLPEKKSEGKDCLSLAFDINKEMKKHLDAVKTTGTLPMGTVSWRTIAGCSVKKDADGTVVEAPALSGKYFLSRD